MKRKEIRKRLGISYLLLREYVKKAHIKPVIILNFHFPVDVNPPLKNKSIVLKDVSFTLNFD
ncbi:hypothetical protein [Saccharolobus islandicus]|jgi:hypothetical protein|uniref:hypothetical protein n=1 Tax=Saccharolobus islandicus TaxID=43080 RepID=UPI00064F5F60|nr:hypothetical protein [Sulfolobus islandicus]